MIRLVILDLDGTIMDAYPAVERSINYTLKKLGFAKRDFNTIRRSVGWGDRQLLEKFVGEEKLAIALKIYRPHHAHALRTGTKLLPGARRVLKQFKKNGYMLAVASNRPTKFSLIALKYLKIKKYFDYILCADKVKKGKPSPVILRQILKKFSLKPAETLYVGDMDIDLIAGKRAHIKTIGVLTGSCKRGDLVKHRPFKIFRDVSAVPAFLQKLNA